MKWIGLTGSIATGKSTVARLIESRGFPVIDADKISHDLAQFGNLGYQQIVEHFGTGILDAQSKIDRKKLGEIVFNSEQEKLKLESILHPLIQDQVQQLKASYQLKRTPVVFYDVPLLFENCLQTQFDSILVVWCQRDVQLQRLMSRDNINESQALSRINSQLPQSEKIFGADFCIDNSGSEYEIIFAVDAYLDGLNKV